MNSSMLIPVVVLLGSLCLFQPSLVHGQVVPGQFVNSPVVHSQVRSADGWYGTSPGADATSSNPSFSGSGVALAGADELLPMNDGAAGQEWREYDLRPFTDRFRQDAAPQQVVVDWILRETGTDAWFSESPAVLSASRERLKVHHRPEIHDIVADIVDRFVQPYGGGQYYSLRLVTVANPNWRSKAVPRLRPVQVQTDGVEAWLLSREDAAIVYNDLRKRSDFREHSSPNLLIANGQAHEILRWRPLAYVKSAHGTGTTVPVGYGGYGVEMGQVEEGFSVSLSPLLARDGQYVDAVVRLETSQVEKLTSVPIPIPTVTNPRQTTQVQVPQTSRWRLHERFRWPANEVLLISCGVVAIPDGESANPVSIPFVASQPPRADALLMIEAKGPGADLAQGANEARRQDGWNFRGRY